MTVLADLAGGVYVDARRGPTELLHACSWKPDRFGARRAACGLVGRFLPPFGSVDFGQFPTRALVDERTPPPVREVPPRRAGRHDEGRLAMTEVIVHVKPGQRVLVLDPDEIDVLLREFPDVPAGVGPRGRLARKVDDIR